MCGFSGYLSSSEQIHSADILHRMGDRIAHRGPDSTGEWHDLEANVGLCHRRLSILDISSAGHQPMVSASDRYVIAFNGEIYNHLSLRLELELSHCAPVWRGHSDTETLLAGFDAWGIEATVKKSVGMFAFAVWDKKTRQLTLGRDRFGEKPLYYGWQGQGDNAVFLFGSELKALRAHPAFENSINRSALSLQLKLNYIPAPYSIYDGISKLLPGHLLTVSLLHREPTQSIFWSASQAAEAGAANLFSGSPNQAIDHLETLLKDAIKQQMISDVPLGAFLSGGIDSSLIVALMQTQSMKPVKTFTIGFNEQGYDEAIFAKKIAGYLGTDHHELYVTPHQAMAVIPRLPSVYDEPFSDSSQIPTYLVSQLAKEHVTVSLSGDAGDELFCGYNRYVMTANLWHKIILLPLPLRRLLATGITSLSAQRWNNLTSHLSLGSTHIGDKLYKGARVLTCETVKELYANFITHWSNAESIVKEAKTLPSLADQSPDFNGLDQIQWMMLLDSMTYLPDDILVKVDRAAMSVSLESRVPFLDHRVFEFAWQLPQSMKLNDGIGKWPLRQVLYRHVPQALIDRPKMGFAVPIDHWLRHDLRDWAETLLNETRLDQEGYLHSAPIRKKWQEHLSGQQNWQTDLWDVLMFQAWLEEQNRSR